MDRRKPQDRAAEAGRHGVVATAGASNRQRPSPVAVIGEELDSSAAEPGQRSTAEQTNTHKHQLRRPAAAAARSEPEGAVHSSTRNTEQLKSAKRPYRPSPDSDLRDPRDGRASEAETAEQHSPAKKRRHGTAALDSTYTETRRGEGAVRQANGRLRGAQREAASDGEYDSPSLALPSEQQQASGTTQRQHRQARPDLHPLQRLPSPSNSPPRSVLSGSSRSYSGQLSPLSGSHSEGALRHSQEEPLPLPSWRQQEKEPQPSPDHSSQSPPSRNRPRTGSRQTHRQQQSHSTHSNHVPSGSRTRDHMGSRHSQGQLPSSSSRAGADGAEPRGMSGRASVRDRQQEGSRHHQEWDPARQGSAQPWLDRERQHGLQQRSMQYKQHEAGTADVGAMHWHDHRHQRPQQQPQAESVRQYPGKASSRQPASAILDSNSKPRPVPQPPQGGSYHGRHAQQDAEGFRQGMPRDAGPRGRQPQQPASHGRQHQHPELRSGSTSGRHVSQQAVDHSRNMAADADWQRADHVTARHVGDRRVSTRGGDHDLHPGRQGPQQVDTHARRQYTGRPGSGAAEPDWHGSERQQPNLGE